MSELTLHRYRRTNQAYTEDLGDGVGLTLMLMPEGAFLMGDGEKQLVRVERFLMGRYPVTQAQWQMVAGYERVDRDLDPNPSRFKGDDRPVEQVSWDDAQEFCLRLSRRTGKGYGLPSEAQWEYGCRAGSETAFCYGDRLEVELANCDGRLGETSDVGSFPANGWGLHDVHGNVWEWCEDDWHDDYRGAPVDGSAWVGSDRKSLKRLLRGGSWNSSPEFCRSSVRFNIARDNRFSTLGFRVSCVLPRILLNSSSP
ncbi:MAG: formylglycine-generating enzyme family protein [Alkalinema sp. RU_4_3]|nr:formylglycine-generating enzyme family protein [Alkalinema sp. RU_4_3]